LADLLRTEAPASIRPFALLSGEEWSWRAEGALLYSVRTGQATFNPVHGMGTFDYYRQHAEAAACLNAAMTNLSGREVAAIMAAYDFAGWSAPRRSIACSLRRRDSRWSTSFQRRPR
jgi:hypothetical protein